MKKALLILIICSSVISCKRQNAWTPSYQKEVYSQMYDATNGMIKDTVQRRIFTLKMIEKLKKDLPYGLNSISSDSLSNLSRKIGEELNDSGLLKKVAIKVPWNNEVEIAMRESMLAKLSKTKIPINKQNAFCDCAIRKMKEIYPDSLVTQMPDSIITNVSDGCKHFLTDK